MGGPRRVLEGRPGLRLARKRGQAMRSATGAEPACALGGTRLVMARSCRACGAQAVAADPQAALPYVALCTATGRLALFSDNRNKARLVKARARAGRHRLPTLHMPLQR